MNWTVFILECVDGRFWLSGVRDAAGKSAGLHQRLSAEAVTFLEGLLTIYGHILVWAAFDTCVLDLLLFPNIKRVRLPGTENMDKEYHQK